MYVYSVYLQVHCFNATLFPPEGTVSLIKNVDPVLHFNLLKPLLLPQILAILPVL